MISQTETLGGSLQPLDEQCCAGCIGGGAKRPSQGSLTPKRQRDVGGGITRISGAFYQINVAMNFIFGGSNNSITTIQGNDIGTINFKALALASS
mgnify:CR=1 FL=1